MCLPNVTSIVILTDDCNNHLEGNACMSFVSSRNGTDVKLQFILSLPLGIFRTTMRAGS